MKNPGDIPIPPWDNGEKDCYIRKGMADGR